jgi:anti-sigma factor RsiW
MNATIPFAQLVDWIEGRLSAEEAARISELAATADAATKANIDWLNRFQETSRQIVIAEPPARVHTHLVDQFKQFAQQRRPSLWQRLTAALTFDSSQQLSLAGVRSGGEWTSDRQLIYATEAAEVALNLQPRASQDHLTLMGQLFPRQSSAAGPYSVQLLAQSGPHAGRTIELDITTTDDLGEFTFESVAPGVYDIVLSSDQLEVVIAPVDLRL